MNDEEIDQRIRDALANAPAVVASLLAVVRVTCKSPGEAAVCLAVAAYSVAKTAGIPFEHVIAVVRDGAERMGN